MCIVRARVFLCVWCARAIAFALEYTHADERVVMIVVVAVATVVPEVHMYFPK